MNILKMLKELVVTGKRFRSTPVVDDDFPDMRDEFDSQLQSAKVFIDGLPQPTKPNAPDGYMEDASGALRRVESIKPIDLLRNDVVMDIVNQARELNALLTYFKSIALSQIASLIELGASEYGVKMGGTKGNVQLISYDGRYKVLRANHDYMSFDEKLLFAKELITQCLQDWSGRPGVPRGLVVIAEKAFRKNAAGEISVARVMDLRTHDIDDDRWKKAMEIIADSIRVQATVTYLRIYERIGNTDQYKQISLDIAGV